MLRNSQAIIGGTIRNVSGQRLENLIIQLELRRRDVESSETRELQVVPQILEPGAEGRYSITVASRQWSGSHLLRLRSGTDGREVVFKSEVGARRPPERPAAGREKVVIVPRPKSKQHDDYLNTPETAIPIH